MMQLSNDTYIINFDDGFSYDMKCMIKINILIRNLEGIDSDIILRVMMA